MTDDRERELEATIRGLRAELDAERAYGLHLRERVELDLRELRELREALRELGTTVARKLAPVRTNGDEDRGPRA